MPILTHLFNNNCSFFTIKNIYEEGTQYNGEDVGHIAMEYYYNDSVQRIVAYIVENEEVMPPSEEI